MQKLITEQIAGTMKDLKNVKSRLISAERKSDTFDYDCLLAIDYVELAVDNLKVAKKYAKAMEKKQCKN